MNKQTQKALDIAKEALFLISASDPAYNAKTTYRVTNHERFGELLREFFEVEDRIRQAHTEQNLNKHLVSGKPEVCPNCRTQNLHHMGYGSWCCAFCGNNGKPLACADTKGG